MAESRNRNEEEAMSESDIDPEDEALIEGESRESDREWKDSEDADLSERQPGRMEERAERQHSPQQHGDEFAVEGGSMPRRV